ncbi:MAG: hypothetical protein JWO58_2992 [Chitinophagaceae bacterium]|nr:hypothetical protein [Chitinophagaceae bacterium]
MKKKTAHIIFQYLLGVGMVFMFTGSFAQEQSQEKQQMTPEDRATKELGRLKTDLSLTTDQEAKLKPILTSYAQQEQTQRQANKEDKEAAKTKHQELQQKKDADLKAVLTPEQYQKLQDKKKENKNGGGHEGHGHGGNH